MSVQKLSYNQTNQENCQQMQIPNNQSEYFTQTHYRLITLTWLWWCLPGGQHQHKYETSDEEKFAIPGPHLISFHRNTRRLLVHSWDECKNPRDITSKKRLVAASSPRRLDELENFHSLTKNILKCILLSQIRPATRTVTKRVVSWCIVTTRGTLKNNI